MAYQGQYQYRSPFGDTTYTKVFVGGLAWETQTEKMKAYFDQFGDILEAVIITDKNTGKSKGYGFVTFLDPQAAIRACQEANPMIDGRRANCNIASFGRPRPSPPRGRNQAQGQSSSSSYSGMPTPQQTFQPTPYFLQPYGYPYTAAYGYQGVYNPQLQQSQYYAQLYGGGAGGGGGGSTTPTSMGNPYYYGGRAGYSSTTPTAAQRVVGPPYYYYPAQMEGNMTQYPNPAAPPFLSSAASVPSTATNTQQVIPSATEEAEVQQSTSEEAETQTST